MTNKPKLMNTFSTGDILSAAAIILAGIGVWVTINVRLAEASTKLDTVEERVDRLEQRIERRLEIMDNKLDRINGHLVEDR